MDIHSIKQMEICERSLLMRMYRSHVEQMRFIAAFDHDGVGESLVRKGYITVEGGVYWFTPAGLDLWKEYSSTSVEKDSKKRWYERQKLKQEAMKKEEEARIMADKLSAWELKARENLSQTQMTVLRDVGRSADEWVDARTIHQTSRSSLVKYGYLEYDSVNQRVRATSEGLARLGTLPEVVMPEDPLPPLKIGKQVVEAVSDECRDCGGCVEKEVLALVAAKYPEIGELVELKKREKQLVSKFKLD